MDLQSQKNPPTITTEGPLVTVLHNTQACILRPCQYFVAWQGVLTLAYSGFPSSLLDLKCRINSNIEGIIKENPGSMWPKTSLACLKDNIVLTELQLQKLRQICSEESVNFGEEDMVQVENLSTVFYQCCCLEKTISTTKVSLNCPVDFSEPDHSEKMNVKKVMDEFAKENLSKYYPHVCKAGHRSAHYRNPRVGYTIVHFLKCPPNSLVRFQEKVEAAMPGLYDWFLPHSLHVTIRALM